MKKALYSLLTISLIFLGGNFVVSNYHHWQQKFQPININGTIVKKPKNLPSFRLLSENGKSFDDSKLTNNWSIVFFGYTHCPDICPTTLTTLGKMYKMLDDVPKVKKPQIVFISIDSKRDNGDSVSKYSKYFNNNFIGLAGNQSQISDLSKSLGVVVQKVDVGTKEESNYIFDHSSVLYVINPRGQLQAILTAPHKAKNLAQDFKSILNKFG